MNFKKRYIYFKLMYNQRTRFFIITPIKRELQIISVSSRRTAYKLIYWY